MAGAVPLRRRLREEQESGNPSGDSSDSGTSGPPSSSRKRARLSNETSLTSPSNNTPITNGYHTQSDLLQRETLQVRPSRRTHQPGSVVRVKLANFVTYTAVEFFPGPSLNMHLGRAKDVSEYVKHGSQEATIEIELAKDGKRFKNNVVVRCTIKRDGNKTVFSVNGKPQGKKAVVDLARSMSIQIDNLCQFLPQDKVVEFAAMTPVELLRSTQRAVASQDMIDMHEELKDLRRKQKDLQSKVDADQDTLSNLEGRQRLQEADVERMREREQVVKRIEMLEVARPTVQYRRAVDGWKEAKGKKRTAQTELDALRTEVEPSLRAANAKQRYKQQIDAVVKERKDNVKKAEEHADKIDRHFRVREEEITKLQQDIDAERTGASKHKKDAVRLEGVIRDLRLQSQNEPPAIDIAAFNDQLRTKQRLWEDAQMQIRDAKEQQDNLRRQGQEKNRQIQDAERGLSQLDSQAGKQNIKLQNLSRDTAKLWQWIQSHPNEFEKPVFGPPVVECSIKNPLYTDLIEALFQRTLFLSCTVQTKNDFRKLSDVAHDHLGLSEVNIKTIPVGLDHFRAPIGEEDMKRYGFEGWALDYINAPEPVLAMLCAEIKIHETGVGMRDTTTQQFDMLQDSVMSSWVTKKSSYRVIRRKEYGPGATSTQVRNIRSASVWTDQPVDLTAKRELQENISQFQEEVHGFEEEIRNIQARIIEYREIYENSKREGKILSDEKTATQKAIGEFKALPTKIAGNEAKLENQRELLAGTKQRLKENAENQDVIAMDRARIALKYADAVESLRVAHNVLHEAEIMGIEATSDHATLVERKRSVKDLLTAKEIEVQEFTREVERSHATSKALLKKVQEIMANDSDDTLRTFFMSLSPEQTVEELDSEIESEKARLELMHEGNGNTIREFEQRRRKIEALASRLAQIRTTLAEMEAGISTLRGKWEPELDGLVKRISDSFSYNMEQISCAGEVSIWKDDDFEQWAIQICVKFRENEPLTTLTSHRQSGGERAVSTIFYLMSLQSLTPSPFRVVDEINQGMDPRNERLVHRRMVDIACGTPTTITTTTSTSPTLHDHTTDPGPPESGGSQYFLITPKLLHDLSYARGMQVMCIASGEYMPEDRTRVDFRACVQRMKALNAERRVSSLDAPARPGRRRVGVVAG